MNTSTTMHCVSPSQAAALQSQVKGIVLLPGEANYDVARTGWNLAVHQKPALILIAEGAQDIAQGVKFAAQQKLWVAVQATGHGVALPANDNLLITTSKMAAVEVDPQTSTARIEAGATWGSVLETTQNHGLAPLSGSSPTVGVIGYTLGGGLGWLARKYGLAADSAKAFEVVTAKGEQLRLNASENPELFWALRGGGGGLAIVTAMEVQLYPVTIIYGGNLMYPPSMVREVFQHYRDWIQQTPEEMSSSIQITNFPRHEMIPEFLQGKTFVMIKGCFCGSVDEGKKLIQYWLDWQKPLENSFRSMPFGEMAAISNDPPDPLPFYHNGCWLQTLNDAAIDTLVEYGMNVNGSSPFAFCEIRHIAGAMGRADVKKSAFGYRGAPFLMSVIAFASSAEQHQAAADYSQIFKRALKPFLDQGAYLNFLDRLDIQEEVHKAFPTETLRRLQEIKKHYDPQNLLRSGFQFSPAIQNRSAEIPQK